MLAYVRLVQLLSIPFAVDVTFDTFIDMFNKFLQASKTAVPPDQPVIVSTMLPEASY